MFVGCSSFVSDMSDSQKHGSLGAALRGLKSNEKLMPLSYACPKIAWRRRYLHTSA